MSALRKIVFLSLAGFYWLNLNCYPQIKLNVTAFNPSNTPQKIDVRQDLPSEFKPEDIIDKGELEINYDVERAVYYVEKKGVDLNPQELHKFMMEVKDIWKIDAKEINFIEQYLQTLTDLLVDLPFKAKKIREEIKSKLEKIISYQKEEWQTIRKRRENYQQSLEILREINKRILSLELMAMHRGVLSPEFIKQSKFLTDLEKEGFLLKENLDRVEFNLKITNPSQDRKEGFIFTHYLPGEIKSEDVWEEGNFQIEYDLEKKLFYLYKKLDLEPGESKIYKIKLRDIWKIDLEKLNLFKDYAQKAVDLLKDSGNYLLGVEIEKDITDTITQIGINQEKEQSLEMRIGAFRDNLSRIEEIKQDIRKLEKLALKVKASGSKVSKLNQDPRFLWGIIPLPPPQTTWRIIWAIIIFLGIFGSAFFILQYSHYKLITIDELTGAFTRRYGGEVLRQTLKEVQEKGGECSVIMIDLDHFKEINDRYGHSTGNTVLRITSNKIKKFLTKEDSFIRYGGEEFLIILPQKDKDKAVSLAEEIRVTFEKEGVNIGQDNLTFTLSLGVANFPQDSQDAKGLMEAADNALYKAKREGRNRVGK